MTRNTRLSEALKLGFGIVIMCDHCKRTIDILVGKHKDDFLDGHIYNTEGSQVCWRCKKEQKHGGASNG